jgi:hypothetical protein
VGQWKKLLHWIERAKIVRKIQRQAGWRVGRTEQGRIAAAIALHGAVEGKKKNLK